jgi:DNA-binding GntR family transcriptional regulator
LTLFRAIPSFKSLSLNSALAITLRIRPSPEAPVKEHRSIVDAIKRGSASEARELTKEHRVRARKQTASSFRASWIATSLMR